jgi:hypothetical protein
MTRWRKYTFVCDPNECDSLLELTVKDGEFKFPNGVAEITCPCGRQMACTSANLIQEEKEKKEEPSMEATTTYLQEQINILQKNLANHTNCDYWKRENGRVQSQIIDLINDSYDNSNDEEYILKTLCEIIDYNPTKEIAFSATITFTGTVQVSREDQDGFELEDILSDVYVDINHGDVVIDSYDLESVDEL